MMMKAKSIARVTNIISSFRFGYVSETKDDRSLQEVFKLFDLIHIVTTDHKILTRIAQEVVEDFATENVVYLELKTTPTEPLKVSRLLKEIIKVSSGYHHSSAITGLYFLLDTSFIMVSLGSRIFTCFSFDIHYLSYFIEYYS
ncbi:uncharacterized protein LOC114301087 isoform X1 [Camellia sinensis]|uniref:uncharacterized protein LOC114301087 isoform X1 n=1 Tax=Camellia sinensis TaxID=4442 RepID=UPI00103557FE|nr:uncharacterized protein LOC114301087 isoform X1 [Camellia sinensis]